MNGASYLIMIIYFVSLVGSIVSCAIALLCISTAIANLNPDKRFLGSIFPILGLFENIYNEKGKKYLKKFYCFFLIFIAFVAILFSIETFA